MVPTVVLTAEEAMKMVPRITKDAAYGMGCTRSQVIWKIVLPTALPGHSHGRHAGGCAGGRRDGASPVHRAVQQLLAVRAWHRSKVMQPTASLAVLIYNFSGMPFETQIELAWTASLVLVMIVLS